MAGVLIADQQAIPPTTKHFNLRFELPEGYKWLPDGAHHMSITSSDSEVIEVPHFQLPDLSFDYKVPIEVKREGRTILSIHAMLFFCPTADESICMFGGCDLKVPVAVSDAAVGTLDIVQLIEPMV